VAIARHCNLKAARHRFT